MLLRSKYAKIVVVVGLFAVIASLIIHFIHAASNTTTLEAEAGSPQGGAAISASASASGGSYVKFAQGGSGSPSGEAMPTGNLTGWTQVYAEDFTSGNVARGSFPGSTYDAKWDVGYGDGTPDTAGQNGEPSRYYPSKVLSVAGGVLDFYLHSENGTPMGAAPMPQLTSGWPINSLTYGRYAVRFKSDSLPGFKTAWLLWPDSGDWSDGEIDFPEGDLSDTIVGFSHCVGNPSANCLGADSGKTFTSWHTAITEWTPGMVAFYLDGVLVGSTTNSVPTEPMHYVMQTESCLTGCPAASTSGHLKVDWVVMWRRS